MSRLLHGNHSDALKQCIARLVHCRDDIRSAEQRAASVAKPLPKTTASRHRPERVEARRCIRSPRNDRTPTDGTGAGTNRGSGMVAPWTDRNRRLARAGIRTGRSRVAPGIAHDRGKVRLLSWIRSRNTVEAEVMHGCRPPPPDCRRSACRSPTAAPDDSRPEENPMQPAISHISAARFWRAYGSPGMPRVRRASGEDRSASSALDAATARRARALPVIRQEAVVHFTVGSQQLRRTPEGTLCHSISNALPADAVFEITGACEVAVVSPELSFVQMGSELSFLDLIRYGSMLCSLFSIEPSDARRPGTLHRRVSPVSSVKAIDRFVESAPRMKGRAAARRALRSVVENARSPLEIDTALHLCLPKSGEGPACLSRVLTRKYGSRSLSKPSMPEGGFATSANMNATSCGPEKKKRWSSSTRGKPTTGSNRTCTETRSKQTPSLRNESACSR